MPLRRFLPGGHFDVSPSLELGASAASPASSERRPSTTTTMTPPPLLFQRLGSPSQPAAAALAHALQSRRFGRETQNEEITYDENSEQTPPPSAHDRQPLHRATSASHGSPPSIASDPNGRRPRRTSRLHGSVSNLSEFTAAHVAPAAGPLVVYQPDWAMPPPMLSRAPSQVWGFTPPPPPMYPPFYFGAFPAAPTLPHSQKELRKAMKQAHKMEKKHRKAAELAMHDGGCLYYCCGGVAKLLWIIILITLFGFVAALFASIYLL